MPISKEKMYQDINMNEQTLDNSFISETQQSPDQYMNLEITDSLPRESGSDSSVLKCSGITKYCTKSDNKMLV